MSVEALLVVLCFATLCLGIEHCTMNVHLLLHLVDNVKLFGPLWTHSCFEFESSNFRLRNAVHGKRFPEKQVEYHTLLCGASVFES